MRLPVVVLAAVLAVAACGGDDVARPDVTCDSPSESSGDELFVAGSIGDVALYADQVAVLEVTGERRGDPGPAYVPRFVTLRIVEDIWRGAGHDRRAEVLPAGGAELVTAGFVLDDGDEQPAIWGGEPRLEVGGRYLAAVFAPNGELQLYPGSAAEIAADGQVESECRGTLIDELIDRVGSADLDAVSAALADELAGVGYPPEVDALIADDPAFLALSPIEKLDLIGEATGVDTDDSTP